MNCNIKQNHKLVFLCIKLIYWNNANFNTFRNICHHNNIVLMPFTSHRVYTLTRPDLVVIRETNQDPRDTAQDKKLKSESWVLKFLKILMITWHLGWVFGCARIPLWHYQYLYHYYITALLETKPRKEIGATGLKPPTGWNDEIL